MVPTTRGVGIRLKDLRVRGRTKRGHVVGSSTRSRTGGVALACGRSAFDVGFSTLGFVTPGSVRCTCEVKGVSGR